VKPWKLILATLGFAWTLTACGGGDSHPAASTLPPGSISTPASTSPSADAIVAAHNSWRSAVGVPALTYSDTLAASAQAWADNLKTTKNCSLTHSNGASGENLYWASAWSNGPAQTITPKQVVDAWGSEKANYNYASNSCAAGKTCGHYTQVVWKNTTSVGCGMAVCDSPKNQVWVCQYLAAGNYVGQKPY
jgi:pathogenesis-related protein 1